MTQQEKLRLLELGIKKLERDLKKATKKEDIAKMQNIGTKLALAKTARDELKRLMG